MIRNPLTLLMLALAMLLAPLGACIGKGHAQAAPAAAAAGHHGASMHGQDPGGHAGHDIKAKHHVCSDCEPPDYLSASKTGPDLAAPFAAAPMAAMPAIARIPAARRAVLAHAWHGRAPPIPPPLPTATKVRLQI